MKFLNLLKNKKRNSTAIHAGKSKRKSERLFQVFQEDLKILEELLGQSKSKGVDGIGKLNLLEKAAILRNIESEDRTRLAWVRTWAAIIAVVLGFILLLIKL